MIVVFDGHCNVCNGFVRFLAARDPRHRLSFIPARSDAGRAWLVACGQSVDDPATMIVVDGDTHHLRCDAVIAAVAALGGGWRAARIGRLLPASVRDALYTAFARRRYRWFGRAETCEVCDGAMHPEA
jgi:predicted DCC family thiol-disulfide oxidoreductase YuxK